MIIHTFRNGTTVEVVEKAPKSFVEDKLACTAPRGHKWFNNNKSLFSGKRISVLVKD